MDACMQVFFYFYVYIMHIDYMFVYFLVFKQFILNTILKNNNEVQLIK